MISIGSSSAVANVIAGYTLIYRRVFKIGDRVKIGDFVGDVVEMRLQVVHLRTIKNEEIVVPSSMIVGSPVINYSFLARERGLILLDALESIDDVQEVYTSAVLEETEGAAS